MTTTAPSLIGRTVEYTGDMANAPRTGYISDVIADRWGTHAVIAWDNADVATGWDDDGEAVTFSQPTTTISVHQIVSEAEARPGDRFRLAE